MPDPLVVRMIQIHKERLLAQEETLMRQMAMEWARIEERIRSEFELLAFEADQLRQKGQPVTESIVNRMEHFQRLMYQVRAETGQYVNWASDEIARAQAEAVQQGLDQAVQAIRTITTDAGALDMAFDILPVDAIESMIGMVGDGSPLLSWLQRTVSPDAVRGMVDALIQGIALGMAPKKVAELMVEKFALGLQRALNTARTEMLRAYRNASLKQYEASGVVVGYRRMSARDARVCPACLFTDGMLVDALDHFDEHNQGRCTLVPVVRGAEDASVFETGTEWFLKQNPELQKNILGPGRYAAWQNGAALKNMALHVDDPVWGGAWVPAPVGNLQ